MIHDTDSNFTASSSGICSVIYILCSEGTSKSLYSNQAVGN